MLLLLGARNSIVFSEIKNDFYSKNLLFKKCTNSFHEIKAFAFLSPLHHLVYMFRFLLIIN